LVALRERLSPVQRRGRVSPRSAVSRPPAAPARRGRVCCSARRRLEPSGGSASRTRDPGGEPLARSQGAPWGPAAPTGAGDPEPVVASCGAVVPPAVHPGGWPTPSSAANILLIHPPHLSYPPHPPLPSSSSSLSSSPSSSILLTLLIHPPHAPHPSSSRSSSILLTFLILLTLLIHPPHPPHPSSSPSSSSQAPVEKASPAGAPAREGRVVSWHTVACERCQHERRPPA